MFIVPDTFLALHLHKNVRRRILRETSIDEILLIPSRFFPGVNFGYSNLCILSFTKKYKEGNKIKIISVNHDVNSLYSIAKGELVGVDQQFEVSQDEVFESLDHAFFLGSDSSVRALINKSPLKLGDVADCVTGFYSGDNVRFIAVDKSLSSRLSKLRSIDVADVDFDFLRRPNLISGLQNGKSYIPILKGGRGAIIKPTDAYVLWRSETVHFYKTDKNARFQNSGYYFKDGIGVPMVKTKRINAFSLDRRLFDQSVVGVFPKDKRYFGYLLAFLNSSTCNLLLNMINHTANNSSNYLKKLPIILDERAYKEADELIESYRNGGDKEAILNSINTLFERIYNLHSA